MSRNKRFRPEESLQRACIKWVELKKTSYPDLEYLFHVPNGGKRTAAEAGILKATGVRPGVPDLLLPLPSPTGQYRGLALELKSPKGRLTPQQLKWLIRLSQDDYFCAVIRNLDDFIRCIEMWYGKDKVEINEKYEIKRP